MTSKDDGRSGGGFKPPATLRFGPVELKFGTVQWLLRVLLVAIIVGIAYVSPPLRNWPMWLSAGGWIAFSIYWSAAARHSAEAKTSESARSRRLHVWLTNGGELLLFLPVPGLGQILLPGSTAWVLSGLAVQAAGVALGVWSRRALGSNWSGRIEIKTEHELVQAGPYRRLRHPIYTAVLGMCLGTMLVDGRAHALVGLVLVVVAYYRKIRMEEAALRDAFGDRYVAYRRRTFGMIPGLF